MDNTKDIQRNIIWQYVATFTGVLALASVGTHFGWPSPSLPVLLKEDSHIPITSAEGGWITVIPVIGSPFGCIMAALLVDRIGRKTSLLIACPLLFCGWLMVAYASSALLLGCGRFLAGMANGLSFTVLPMYIGEISDPRIRGFLGSCLQVAYNLGVLLINIVGIHLSVKMTALCAAVLPLIFLVTYSWAPESPYFFILKKQKHKAANSLKRLTGKDNVEKEVSEFVASTLVETQRSGRSLDLFTEQSNRKALMIIIGLLSLQHLSGYMAIMFYCLSIFREASGSIKESFATIIYFSVSLITSSLGSILVDRTGRRPLLVISFLVSGIGLSIEGIYFYLKNKTSVDTTTFGFLPLTALILCTISSNIGLTYIPSLLMGELFPTNVKAYAVCLSNVTFSVVGAIVAKLFQMIKDEYGLYVPFLLFAICCVVGLIFTLYCVPETKGKTLEQIQNILRGSNYKENITLDNEQRTEFIPCKKV